LLLPLNGITLLGVIGTTPVWVLKAARAQKRAVSFLVTLQTCAAIEMREMIIHVFYAGRKAAAREQEEQRRRVKNE
jgi:hypothetical protein